MLANAIDVSRFTPGRAPGGRYDAVWVGRLDAEKNPLAFVDALARLRDDGHPVRAAMVGDGPLANAVRARIDAFDLAPDIDLAGWVSDPVDYYRRADAFVLTSHRDALPLSLIESMACGVVPIVPDVGNVRDVVTDGENGLVVEAADASQVAAGLQRLVTDHQFRSSLSTDGSDVRAAYSYEAASEDWETILDILAQPSPANGPRDRVVVA